MKKRILPLLLVLCLLLGSVAAAAAPVALAREQSITVDGKKITFQTYALKDEKGNETNYVKLRDVASALNGTSAQFHVGWDGSVNIETGKAYVPNGSEMSTPFTGDRPYAAATAPTKVNGAAAELDAVVLTDDQGAGYTYYKLRDLGEALGFGVDWTAKDGILVSTQKAEAPAGKIEHPAVTDPTLTAPTGLKLVIGTRTEYGSDGQPKQVSAAVPGVAFTNTAGDRAKDWIIRLYDEKDRRLLDTFWNGNPAELVYSLAAQESGTISTVTITPVDPGADGYVSRGANSDDKVGVTAELKCQITVATRAGEPVTLSTSPTDWSEEDWNLTLSLKTPPFAYGILTSKYTETYPDGVSVQHTTGSGVSADESGKLEYAEEISRFEKVYASPGAKLSLAMFSDAAVSGATGSYTVTVHPITVQK